MFKKILLATICSTFCISSVYANSGHPTNFSAAKKILGKKIFSENDKTFYCGCDMSFTDGKLKPILSSCNFEPRKNKKRASRIEWEHIVPAWYFGHQLQCWQDGGRKLCGKDKQFRKMESDMHNLVPAIGEVNGDRSNFSLTMIANEKPYQYGKCNMIVNFKEKKAQPRISVRGDVARTYFYMADKYGLQLSNQDIKIYKVWSNQDPVSKEEIERNNKVKKYQGDDNEFVTGEKSVSNYKNKKTVVKENKDQSNEEFNKKEFKNNNKNDCSKKKFCSQMISCDEAKFFLNSCGLTKLDKNKDGIPCESLCKKTKKDK